MEHLDPTALVRADRDRMDRQDPPPRSQAPRIVRPEAREPALTIADGFRFGIGLALAQIALGAVVLVLLLLLGLVALP